MQTFSEQVQQLTYQPQCLSKHKIMRREENNKLITAPTKDTNKRKDLQHHYWGKTRKKIEWTKNRNKQQHQIYSKMWKHKENEGSSNNNLSSNIWCRTMHSLSKRNTPLTDIAAVKEIKSNGTIVWTSQRWEKNNTKIMVRFKIPRMKHVPWC